MNWLFFALISPLLFAIAILIDDHLLRNAYKGPTAGAIISGFFGLIPVILILAAGRATRLPEELVLLSLVSGIAVVVGYFLYFKALQHEEPSIVSALMCVSPAIIPFIAYFVVDERLSTTAYIGFAIVITAGFLYSLSDVKKFKISKSLLPILTAAIIFDVVSIANKYVYTKADFFAAYLYFSLGIFLGGVIFFGFLRLSSSDVQIKDVYRKNSVKLLLLLALAEFTILAGGFAADRAASLGSISVVKALANLQPLYVLGFALLLYPFFPKYFREAESGNRGYKLILLGLILIGAFVAAQ